MPKASPSGAQRVRENDMRDNKRDIQNLGLASLGAVLEYFDFVVYVFVAVAISDAFFPPGASSWLKQMQTFGIYAVGYLVRPIAGMIIAHFADQIGRKKLFIFTVLLMSVPNCRRSWRRARTPGRHSRAPDRSGSGSDRDAAGW